ncbi:hypothetical protein PSE_4405 [Pseudovibrio sp. FO-BEG1]|nr:hypothetical protein PSE_4405 [Pseudovibrio sp. FO-BEG1]
MRFLYLVAPYKEAGAFTLPAGSLLLFKTSQPFRGEC